MEHDIRVGEALAILSGLELSLDVGFASLEVETHNIQVAQALQRPSKSISDFEKIFEDIRHLSSSFIFVTFSHCHKVWNWPAHYLAKLANSSLSPLCMTVWMEEILIVIVPHVDSDVLNCFQVF